MGQEKRILGRTKARPLTDEELGMVAGAAPGCERFTKVDSHYTNDNEQVCDPPPEPNPTLG